MTGGVCEVIVECVERINGRGAEKRKREESEGETEELKEKGIWTWEKGVDLVKRGNEKECSVRR